MRPRRRDAKARYRARRLAPRRERRYRGGVSGSPVVSALLPAAAPNERRLRRLAILGAALSCAWLTIFALRLPANWASASGNGVANTIVNVLGLLLLYPVPSILLAVWFVGRARGKVGFLWGQNAPALIWLSLVILSPLWGSRVHWSTEHQHRVSFFIVGLSVILGFFGSWLETKRDK